MVESYSYKSKQYGALCTIVVHGIIFLLLLLQIRTKIPPYPEGGGGTGNGIELNLGFTDAGSGMNPIELASPNNAKPSLVTNPQQDNKKLLTQEVEDVPPIKEQTVEAKKVKKEVKKVVVDSPNKTTKKEIEKPQQVVNQKALYKGNKNQTSADGDKKVQGDQGDPNGSLAAKAFGGQGGKGGSGGGSGGGKGTGSGPGIGSGPLSNLAGRYSLSLPAPEYKHQVEGVVIVEVTVDKEGKVTQAIPGVKGSTTLDENLLEAARNAALQARFDRKPDAPAFQKGTITYRFRLQ